MTIITKPITEKKLAKQKEPLVDDNASAQHVLSRDPEAGNVHSLVAVMRSRRVTSMTTFCVFLTALLIFFTGLLGAYYTYREFTQYKTKHFRGWCSVPYAEPQQLTQYGSETHSLDQGLSDLFQKVYKSVGQKQGGQNKLAEPFHSFFDEQFDIDIEYEEYEKIEVPDFSHGRRGRFIHDFALNKTGIIDLEEGRCFILPLNRSQVLPPHSLYDLISKMRSGYYDIDTEVVREYYRVVLPAIDDVKELGFYIGQECENLPTYSLEKMTSPVFKRDISEFDKNSVFAEFAGVKLTEMKIVNLASIPGKKNK